MARVVRLIDGSARFDEKSRQLLNALQSGGMNLIGTGLDWTGNDMITVVQCEAED